MPNTVTIGKEEINVSLPYSDEEMHAAYDDFLLEIKGKMEREKLEEELSRTVGNFFFYDQLSQILRVLHHLQIDFYEFYKLSENDQCLVLNKAFPSLLASKIQEKHELPEKVAWAMAVTAISNRTRR